MTRYVICRYNQEVKAVSDDKETAIEEVLKKYDFSIEETEEELETYDGELHTESYVANIKANIAEAEANRIKNLNCTKREFMLGLYNLLNIDFYATVYPLIEANTLAKIEWEGCERIYRGNELLNTIGTQLGLTSAQLDTLFRTIKGEFPVENSDTTIEQ